MRTAIGKWSSWSAAAVIVGAFAMLRTAALADDSLIPASPVVVDSCSIAGSSDDAAADQASKIFVIKAENHNSVGTKRIVYHITDQFDDFTLTDQNSIPAGGSTTQKFTHAVSTDFTSGFFGKSSLRCEVHAVFFTDDSQWPQAMVIATPTPAADAPSSAGTPSSSAAGDFLNSVNHTPVPQFINPEPVATAAVSPTPRPMATVSPAPLLMPSSTGTSSPTAQNPASQSAKAAQLVAAIPTGASSTAKSTMAQHPQNSRATQASAAGMHHHATFGILLTQSATNSVVILAVVPGGHAEAAGLKVGDTIVALNGHMVHALAPTVAALKALPAGAAFTIGIMRDGAPMTVNATLPPAAQ